MMVKLFFGFFMGLTLVSCQQAPTKIYESQPTQLKENKKIGGSAEVRLSEKTILIDARPPFDYAISHLNGALSLRGEEFTQTELPYVGLLDADRFSLTRRLARKGLSPETPVVVIGKGPLGRGEEGRMAWTLKILGVRDVQYASIEAFSIPLTNAEAPPREAVPLWRPQGDETLEVSRDEFVKAARTPKTKLGAPLILDVRTEAEYLGKVKIFEKSVPDVAAINIPWTEFFDARGLAKTSVKDRLAQIEVHPDRVIYVISNKGFESAAVTVALRDLGFTKAANFAGGYQQLIFAEASSRGDRKSESKLKKRK